MSLLFKNCSLVEVMYLLISFNKTKSFLWNTKNTDRNGVNSKTQTTHTQKKVFRKGLLVLVIPLPFSEQPFPLHFCQPLSFYGKMLNPSFLRKFWKLKLPFSFFYQLLLLFGCVFVKCKTLCNCFFFLLFLLLVSALGRTDISCFIYYCLGACEH